MKTGSSGAEIAFRTDASLEIGTGHVMRCLTLADALRDRGANCLFLTRLCEGNLLDSIAARGHRVVPLTSSAPCILGPEGPPHVAWLGTHWENDAAEVRQALVGENVDWLVVDHYGLDQQWESRVQPMCHQLLVMDDLADRAHDCDMLLDPSLGRERGDYQKLVPNGTTMLLGPQFALLRPQFAALRLESLTGRERPKFRHLLVTMGGVDNANMTERVLDAIDVLPLPEDLRITVVMGAQAPWLEEVQARAHLMRFDSQVEIGVNDMARLMADCDLAISAAGATSWECCCMGLPTIIFCLAENQRQMAKTLHASGAVMAVKGISEMAHLLTELTVRQKMDQLLTRVSSLAARITDGQGRERVCTRMLG